MFDFIKKLFSGGNKSQEIKELIANGAIILDARTPGEYKSGHIKKAVNYPVQTIQSDVHKIKKLNKPVVAYCRSGMRSASAVAIMKNAGIQAVNAGSMSALEGFLR